LPTFPENFMQIRSEVFCTKLLTDRQRNTFLRKVANKQTDRQTNNDENIGPNLLGGGNNISGERRRPVTGNSRAHRESQKIHGIVYKL